MKAARLWEQRHGDYEMQFMVGRQPIFDTKLDVFGYELLFRNGRGPGVDGDAMTADVLVRAGLDVGLDGLVGDKLAFVNATRPFLVGEREVSLPSEQTVIEVLEDVVHDEEVVKGCQRLVEDGYTLALDDYLWSEGDEPLLQLAAIVKLDLLATPAADLRHQVERCSAYGAKLVAEKVETAEQMARCRDLGFDLFQGYLLSRPETVEGKTLSPSRLTCLRLIERLCDPDVSAKELEQVVITDPGLSHRFLKAAGAGAAGGLRRPVSSIREGVVLLGERRMRSWTMLMLLGDSGPASAEQLAIAMCRARMSELAASVMAPGMEDSAFTVGLVSALDVLLGAPLAEIVANLTVTEDLVGALMGRTGTLGSILSDVLAWELGDDSLQPRTGLEMVTLERIYVDALRWANDVCGML